MTQQPLDFDALLADYTPGHALPRGFYTSDAIFDREIAALWNQSWIWVGHESQIPESGDYFLFDYGPESIIVVRDRDRTIRAHLNVCRHRGSRVCTGPAGHLELLVCPYHAWTYELSGELRSRRGMGADFDPANWGLRPAQVIVFQGMILVCATECAPSLDEGLAQLSPLTEPFGFENLKLAHTKNYLVPANWKLALENYLECFHCTPSHREYSKSHTLTSPRQLAAKLGPMQERSVKAGLPVQTLDLTGSASMSPGTDVYYRRYPLFDGYQTGSKDGEPLAPLLGSLKGFDGGATDVMMGILNSLLVYSDHVVGYRFVPRTLQETEIQVSWMVRGDAQEGSDYHVDELTWLWHVTSLDDERIIRHNQEGVNSHFFRPGPLAEMEWAIPGFYDFYLAMISQA